MPKSWMVVAALAFSASLAQAHGDEHGKATVAQPMVETPFGRTGDPGKVSRTVQIDMSDALRFTPAEVTVKRGETVKFVVKNSGRMLHEMVLGTRRELVEHAALMRRFPNMEHDEPFMTHVPPGETGQIVWQFTKRGEFFYGCLVPGHFEAGMVGKLTVN